MSWKSVNFDWNRARAFLVTAEEGSLSAAARALNMTQPTLSRQVSALESELKVTLFERVNQGLVLTESGVQLLKFVRQMGDAASQFSLTANGQEQQLEGVVSIATTELDAVFRMPDIAQRVRAHEPGIELEFVVSNEVSDLKRRDADIALRSFRPDQSDLIARKLFQERVSLYASAEYLDQFNHLERFEDVKEAQFIGFERTDQMKKALTAKGWQENAITTPMVTTFQLMQIELAKHNMGFILLPEDIAEKVPELVRAFGQHDAFMTLDVWLVTHRELHTNPRVRRVFDIMVETLAEPL